MSGAPKSASTVYDVTLESKVAFLRQASSYAEPAYRIEAIETHMSWIFLTDDFAYKLKKPVSCTWLDFLSIEARHHYCEEELRLNRRLAAEVYIGLVALSIDEDGHLHVGRSHTVIDWLVKMHRLPAQHMLDYAIKNKTVCVNDMRRIAIRLAMFYRECLPVSIDAATYRATFLADINQRFETLSKAKYQLPIEPVRKLCNDQRHFLQKQAVRFNTRVKNKKIIEGHGDLRPEHICLEPTVEIIDCLEFSRALRVIDPVDELGFLALECERLEVPDLGQILLQVYSEASGDWPDTLLLHFYQSYRALLRASIAIRHLDEEKFRYSSEWRTRANNYLTLAQKHQDAINSVIESPA